MYTDPEIASAGLTEDEAKEKGIEVETGKFIMSANGRSIITKEERDSSRWWRTRKVM